MSRPVHIEELPPFVPPRRSYTEVDRDEIVRQTLEEAARRIESRQGNPTYQTAWRTAAKIIRAMKP